MNRRARLHSARTWLDSYEGKNVVRSYRKRYAVDILCACLELRKLGLHISSERIEQAQRTVEGAAKARKKRREARRSAPQTEFIEEQGPWDYMFEYVAGYTSAGFPYGVTREEMWEAEEREKSRTEGSLAIVIEDDDDWMDRFGSSDYADDSNRDLPGGEREFEDIPF